MNKKKPEKIDQKKISAKDVLYAEIDDEITTLVDRIRRAPGKEIYLVVPQRALLFQSIVNLRILAKMADEMNKDIFIVTADKKGRKLSEEAGLSMVDKLEGVSYVPRNLEPSLAITPLKKKKGEEPKKKRVQKIAIAEILESERTKTKQVNLRDRFEKSKDYFKDKAEELNLNSPNRKLFIGIFSLALIIFFGVIYIALPSATIKVQPAANIIEKTVNLIFTNIDLNPAEIAANKPRNIPVDPVETIFEKTLNFNATEKIFTGSNASGNITIYNETTNDWFLIGGTRFQAENGAIFRVGQQISVPGAVEIDGELVPGQLRTRVVADPTDAYNDITGDRGNISSETNLTIPGLSEYNQQFLYAKAAEDFQGGATDYYTIISENDIKAARESIMIEIEAAAYEELSEYISERNKTTKDSYVLFDNPQGFESEVLDVQVPEELAGTENETFEVYAKMRVSGLAYNRTRMLSILEQELRNAVHPDKVLVSVNTDGITLNTLPETYNETTGKITVVAVIEGVEEWNLDPSSPSGEALNEKIKTHTMGKSVLDAEKYVQNLREISKAEVSVWPFWAKSLPNMASAIKIEVVHN